MHCRSSSIFGHGSRHVRMTPDPLRYVAAETPRPAGTVGWVESVDKDDSIAQLLQVRFEHLPMREMNTHIEVRSCCRLRTGLSAGTTPSIAKTTTDGSPLTCATVWQQHDTRWPGEAARLHGELDLPAC